MEKLSFGKLLKKVSKEAVREYFNWKIILLVIIYTIGFAFTFDLTNLAYIDKDFWLFIKIFIFNIGFILTSLYFIFLFFILFWGFKFVLGILDNYFNFWKIREMDWYKILRITIYAIIFIGLTIMLYIGWLDMFTKDMSKTLIYNNIHELKVSSMSYKITILPFQILLLVLDYFLGKRLYRFWKEYFGK